MKTFIKLTILVVLVLSLANEGKAYFNEPFSTVADSLTKGGLYWIKMGSNYEIEGKVLEQDSATIRIETPEGTYRIRKSDIAEWDEASDEFKKEYYFVGYKKEEKSNLLLNFSGGLSLIGFGNLTGFNLNGGIVYVTDGNLGTRLNLGFKLQPSEDFDGYYSTGTGGDILIYSLNLGVMLGKLKSKEDLLLYGGANLDIMLWHETESRYTYSDPYSNHTFTNTYAGQTDFFYSLGLGGGIGYNVSKKLSLYAEANSPLLMGSFEYNRIGWGFGMVDLKLGVMYRIF